LPVGPPATIRRISEVAEHDARELLLTLAEHEMAEGSSVQVLDVAVAQNERGALVGGRRIALSLAAAQLIWVEVAAWVERRFS